MALKAKIKKDYGDFKLDVDFAIDRGLAVLFGPSGAGKSAILRIVAGLSVPDDGEITLDDKRLFCSCNRINLLPQQRNIGYIFQNHVLFPHFTVIENIIYGAKRLDKGECQEEAQELIEKFKMEGIAYKYPSQISGGQQQKVAFARVIISKPAAFLLDEPFSSLDTETRTEIKINLKNIHNELNIPTIFVTHDIYEACSIADTMLVIVNGKITKKESIPQYCNELISMGD